MDSPELSPDSHDATDQVPTLWMERPDLDDRPARNAALALFPSSERLPTSSKIARDLLDAPLVDGEPITTVRGRPVAPAPVQRIAPAQRHVQPRANVNVTARGPVATTKPRTVVDPEIAAIRARAEAAAAARQTLPRVATIPPLTSMLPAPVVASLADTELASPIVVAAGSGSTFPATLPATSDTLPPVAEPRRPARARKQKQQKHKARARRAAPMALETTAPALPVAPALRAQPMFGSGMLKAHARVRTPVLPNAPAVAIVPGTSATLPGFGAGMLQQRNKGRAWLFVVLAIAAIAGVALALSL
jgi:hypothetical protein